MLTVPYWSQNTDQKAMLSIYGAMCAAPQNVKSVRGPRSMVSQAVWETLDATQSSRFDQKVCSLAITGS